MSTWTASKAFTRVTEALERAGCRSTGSGRQLSFCCPAHDDRNPSLSVTDGEERVLIWCHSPSCDTDSVLEKLGLGRADLFDTPGNSHDQPRRRVVAQYRYTDENGELLFVKERLEPKSFRIKRPDGHGGWAWNLAPDTRRVLYRLPRVLAAPDSAVIFIAEGERDVDALEGAGEIATTNYDGAGRSGEHPKWRADYAPVLAGRDVLVVADRDEDGREHARYIAASLDRVARFCWIIEAAEGKDAADHLGAGLTVGAFRWWDR